MSSTRFELASPDASHPQLAVLGRGPYLGFGARCSGYATAIAIRTFGYPGTT